MGKWSSLVAMAVMALGLYAMPAAAVDGTVNGMNVGTVACVNLMTSQVVQGQLTATGFDCSGLTTSQGDAVNIGLFGSATEGGTGNCTPVTEQEPNDSVGGEQVLSPNPCVSVSGAASSAEDIDAYRLNLTTAQLVQLAITPAGTPFTVLILDASGPGEPQPLGLCGDPGPQPRGCEAELSGSIVVALLPCNLDAEGNLIECVPGSYTLEVTVGGGGVVSSAQDTPDAAYNVDLRGVEVWR